MNVWDQQYIDGHGRYFPAEELVRFLGRTYGPVLKKGGAGLTAIDIGCGVGGNVIALADWGFFTMALECSTEAMKLAREHVDRKGIGHMVNFSHYRAPAGIKYPANSTNLVIDIQTIQHLNEDDHVKMYQEIYRVLSHGGRFFSIHWVGDPSDREEIFPVHPELNLWQSSTTVRSIIEEAGLVVAYLEIVLKTYKHKWGRWAIIEAVKA